MTARTDPHAPVNFDPESYTYIGAFDNTPPETVIGPNANGQYLVTGGRLSDYALALKAKVAASKTARYGSSFQCDHCGAAIRYVGVFRHEPTGDHIAVGQTCQDGRFELASKAQFDALRKAAQFDREKCRILTAWNTFIDEHEAPWAELVASENPFVIDVLRKGRQYGALSEKQLAAIVGAVTRDAQRAAEATEAPEEVRVPVVTGKGVTVKGTVVSKKWKETDFGDVLKWMVKVVPTGVEAEGFYLVWGTVPGAIAPAVGDVVKFVANVESSDRDISFGFAGRPRKAVIVERKGGEVVAA